MALTTIVKTLVLDVYDHDQTQATIKAIALDSKTRYVQATLTYMGADYPVSETAAVTLTVLRPDKVGAQVVGSVVDVDNADRTGTIKGVYAELTQAALAVKNSILSDNLLLKNALMTTVRGLFTVAATLTVENTNICNNVVGEVSSNTSTAYNQYILRCTGALTLRNVKMMGNIRPLASVQSNVKDYSIGTPVIENCLFDWEL